MINSAKARIVERSARRGALAKSMKADPHNSIADICATLKISKRTLYRYTGEPKPEARTRSRKPPHLSRRGWGKAYQNDSVRLSYQKIAPVGPGPCTLRCSACLQAPQGRWGTRWPGLLPTLRLVWFLLKYDRRSDMTRALL